MKHQMIGAPITTDKGLTARCACGEWIEVDGPRCRAVTGDTLPGDAWLLADGTLVERDAASNSRHSPYGTSIMRRVGSTSAAA